MLLPLSVIITIVHLVLQHMLAKVHIILLHHYGKEMNVLMTTAVPNLDYHGSTESSSFLKLKVLKLEYAIISSLVMNLFYLISWFWLYGIKND